MNDREGKRKIFHSLVHSQKSFNIWSWARLKPGVRHSNPYPTWVAQAQEVGHFLLVFPGHIIKEMIRSERDRIWTALLWEISAVLATWPAVHVKGPRKASLKKQKCCNQEFSSLTWKVKKGITLIYATWHKDYFELKALYWKSSLRKELREGTVVLWDKLLVSRGGAGKSSWLFTAAHTLGAAKGDPMLACVPVMHVDQSGIPVVDFSLAQPCGEWKSWWNISLYHINLSRKKHCYYLIEVVSWN